MGWFDKCLDFGRSAVGFVGDAIDRVKEVAGEAIGWMATKAEGFVGTVKTAWHAVKPYVEQIRTVIRTAAAALPIPWLSSALTMLDAGLGALTAFENSPIAKKVDAAIKWAIALAKRWQEKRAAALQEVDQGNERLNDNELQMAKGHQETFRFAEREAATEDQQHQLEIAAAINDFEIAKTDLANAIDVEPTDFEHYLRLRATQKLLNLADKKFRTAMSMDDLSVDDLFLVRIASDLIKDKPELSQQAAERLDRLLTERYGKKLTPFVFEELVACWSKRAETLGVEWDASNRQYAKNKMLLKRLTLAKKVQQELSEEECAELVSLEKDVPLQKEELDAIATQQQDIETYVGAVEGFLQLLEKTCDQIKQENRGYLLEKGAEVGRLLIDCAKNDKPFSAFAPHEQSLITDFANIFQSESKRRMQDLLEVTA